MTVKRGIIRRLSCWFGPGRRCQFEHAVYGRFKWIPSAWLVFERNLSSMIRLVVTDVDGTLIEDGGTVASLNPAYYDP